MTTLSSTEALQVPSHLIPLYEGNKFNGEISEMRVAPLPFTRKSTLLLHVHDRTCPRDFHGYTPPRIDLPMRGVTPFRLSNYATGLSLHRARPSSLKGLNRAALRDLGKNAHGGDDAENRQLPLWAGSQSVDSLITRAQQRYIGIISISLARRVIVN